MAKVISAQHYYCLKIHSRFAIDSHETHFMSVTLVAVVTCGNQAANKTQSCLLLFLYFYALILLQKMFQSVHLHQ